ncbi:MAG: DegV family protein [Oscillospiraceae bacterium]|nr:DegV family protein [Oscillospiraceae bacterium]
MSKIILTADSGCDLGPELIAKYDIRIIPIHVTLEGKEYLDGVGMTSEEMLQICEAKGIVPKTSALNPTELEEFFKPLIADGSQVVHISISSAVSTSYQSAVLAASDLEGVHIVDSKTLSAGMALLMCKAYEMREAGLAAADIAEKLTALTQKTRASFVLETPEWLHKGGRISTAKFVVASALGIKPCIEVDTLTGTMGPGKKYRGKFDKALLQYVDDKLANAEYDNDRIFITHAGVEDSLIEQVKMKICEVADFKEIIVTRAGMTITTHCGRNTLGVLFVAK